MELAVLKKVNHPFVIKYIEEFNYKEDKHCVVTEYVPGGDLQRLMNQDIHFTEDYALSLLTMLLLSI